VITEQFQLGVQGLLNGSLDDLPAHIDGQRLDGIEVDVESRPFVSKSTPRDNFSPTVRHVAKVGQIIGPTLGKRHPLFVLELGE
jgi:hypothetical protein